MKFFFLFLFMISASNSSGAQEYMSGEVLTKEGAAIKISKIEAGDVVRGSFKGKELEIRFSKLKRIDLLSNETIRVTNLHDKTFLVENAHLCCFYDRSFSESHRWRKGINFNYFDEITMEKKVLNLYTREINQIVLSSALGRLRYNERTRQYFPPDYLFDPYTGEELKWRSPEY